MEDFFLQFNEFYLHITGVSIIVKHSVYGLRRILLNLKRKYSKQNILKVGAISSFIYDTVSLILNRNFFY